MKVRQFVKKLGRETKGLLVIERDGEHIKSEWLEFFRGANNTALYIWGIGYLENENIADANIKEFNIEPYGNYDGQVYITIQI